MKTFTLFAAAFLLATSISSLAPTKAATPGKGGPDTPIPICPSCGRG